MSAGMSRHFSSHELCHFAEVAIEMALPILCAEGILEGDRGGFACFLKMNRPHGLESTPIVVPWIGVVSDSTVGIDRRRCAQQRAWRLLAHPADVSSFQSREPSDEGTFAGAIRASNYIFSFAGPLEFVDEAMMLLAAVHATLLTQAEAEQIALISRNPYFAKLIG